MSKKMDIKKCEVCDKFFDVISFNNCCPHCGNDNSKKSSITKKDIFKIFDMNKNKNIISESTSEVPEFSSVNFTGDSSNNVSINDDFKTIQEIDAANDVKNVDNSVDVYSKNDVVSANIQPIPITPADNIMPRPSIREEIDIFKNDDDMKTVQVYNTPKKPVVGWLVCVKGACMGESYSIRSGNNKIGRSKDNDIVIEDSIISREQAVIKFEPHKQIFYMIPNINASKFMYIDDNEVMERICLEPYTRIEIGDSVGLIFVPFCGEHFNWKFCE